jgi:hypothetical protein
MQIQTVTKAYEMVTNHSISQSFLRKNKVSGSVQCGPNIHVSFSTQNIV